MLFIYNLTQWHSKRLSRTTLGRQKKTRSVLGLWISIFWTRQLLPFSLPRYKIFKCWKLLILHTDQLPTKSYIITRISWWAISPCYHLIMVYHCHSPRFLLITHKQMYVLEQMCGHPKPIEWRGGCPEVLQEGVEGKEWPWRSSWSMCQKRFSPRKPPSDPESMCWHVMTALLLP